MASASPRDWRAREERILQLAHVHVVSRRHLRPYFPSDAAAYKKVRKLVEQRKLRKIGTVMLQDVGRAEDVFCNGWKPRMNHLRHELLLSDFLLAYPSADVVRGWRVDKRIRPDAEMTLEGNRFNVELDTGTEDYRQVKHRQRAYRGVTDFLLYVTTSERRRDGLVRHSEAVRNIALFATLEDVLAEPHGEVWRDCFGNRASI